MMLHLLKLNGLWMTVWLVIPVSCFSHKSFGVVINVDDGSQNVTAPDDDPGFANVAIRGAGTAVYLGNRWMLTAAHVGAGSVKYGDKEFTNVVDESFRLTNREGFSHNTDMLLFRLEEDPGLPALQLGCNPVSVGGEVVMIGGGRDREVERSFWKVKVIDGDDNDIWTSVETEAEADHVGYRTLDTRSIRWGNNYVNLNNIEAESGHGDVESFSTTFQPIIPVDWLAQGVRGDSGGPVFKKNYDVWELVGLMHAVGLKDNQPGQTNTALIGNETFIADLFAYADTIREIADFEPAPGDIDGNGIYTIEDIDRMLSAMRARSPSCHFDLTGDRVAKRDDLELLLTLASSLEGDANLDGTVQFNDFLSLARGFNLPDRGWGEGDFDGDGVTTFGDFLLLARNFGETFESSAKVVESSLAHSETFSSGRRLRGLITSVPEPSAWIVWSACLLFLHRPLRRAYLHR